MLRRRGDERENNGKSSRINLSRRKYLLERTTDVVQPRMGVYHFAFLVTSTINIATSPTFDTLAGFYTERLPILKASDPYLLVNT